MQNLVPPIPPHRQMPVLTLTLGALMTGITAMYLFGKIQELPCGSDLISSFARNFIHVSPVHLLMNMFAFYQFSSIETIVGSTQYLILIISLAVLQTIIEIISRNFLDLTCSIGFSGVLYGILTWTLLSGKQTNSKMIIAVLLSIFSSSAHDPQLSLAGHLMGVAAGAIAALVTPSVTPH